MQIQDNVFIITGGASGLGAATARMLAGAGGKVVLADVQVEAGSALAAELGGKFVKCDVTSEADGKAVVETAVALGTLRGLINCAGVAPAAKTVGKDGAHSLELFQRTVNINLVGTFNCCHAVIPHMLRQKKGKIFNLKGYGADFPSPRVTAYGATKAALVAFTRSLAREYKGTGITANIFSPGMVKTDLLMSSETTEEGRPYREKVGWFIDMLANPVEVPAALAVKIASPENDGVTGKVFQVMTKPKFIYRALKYGLKRLTGRSRPSY